MKTIMLLAVAILALTGPVAARASAAPDVTPDQVWNGDGGGVDGCNSAPVAVGDPNYDGACDEPVAYEVTPEYSDTVDGLLSRCRTIEEKLRYASLVGTMIWEYVQQVHWCWGNGIIRTIDRIRFTRLSTAGSIYWDFKGHIASSCAAWADYSPCSERAGRGSAYIATQGKFQTITCGVKLFCVTKTPGMWVTITGYGKVAGYGKL